MPNKRLLAVGTGSGITVAVVALVLVARPGAAGDSNGVSLRPDASPAPSPGVSVSARPLLVINPRSVRHGDSISVWGSHFPVGATVAIYLKEDASDNVNPVSVVEADQSGKFGGLEVTVPDSVSTGGLIVEAKDRASGSSATASATVVDRVPELTGQPQTPAQVTATAQATPQPKPTEPPMPTPQSTAPLQPTPQPKPTEPPTAAPGSYTIQAGDSLSAIAERVYGNANDWRSLYEANRDNLGGNPNLIHPGTELVIPPKE